LSEKHTIRHGAVCSRRSQASGSPSSAVAVQNCARAAAEVTTRNDQPWVWPADGARTARSSSSSITSRDTGTSGW
jgi:hypothetical protein